MNELPGWKDEPKVLEPPPAPAVVKPSIEQIAMRAQANPAEYTSLPLYEQLMAQAKYELELMKRLPEMKKQRTMLESRISIIQKCLVASQAGFAEFHPAQGWLLGFLSAPMVKNRLHRLVKASDNYNLYTRPMPAVAIEAYIKARALGVFTAFTIHSPDASAFREYVPQISTARRVKNSAGAWVENVLSKLDPVLIGWVNGEAVAKDGSDSFYNISEVSQSDIKHPFLVAAWDLGVDLQFMAPQIAAPKAASHNHRGDSCPITCPANPYF